MMYLSKVPTGHPAFSHDAWGNVKQQHHDVMSLFGDLSNDAHLNGGNSARSTGDILFRVDQDRGHVLVQSTTEPTSNGFSTIDMGRLFDNIQDGSQIGFTLRANTVKTVNHRENGVQRKFRVRIDDEELPGWIQRRLEGIVDVDQDSLGGELDSMDAGQWRIDITDYRGSGTVIDKQALIEICRNGVGRSKSFGCGLLTVLPQ